MDKPLKIAIDGPVAAGKSTVAKLLGQRLGLVYVDTGAMYRAVALGCRSVGVAYEDEVEVVKLVEKLDIDLRQPGEMEADGRGVSVFLNGRDVTWEIRTSDIAEGASIVSQYAAVRTRMVALQQAIAAHQGVVMEGRDIGSRVLPDAQLKLYLTADLEQRALWKQAYLAHLGQVEAIEEVRRGIQKRDEREMNREIDPLTPASGAWILDTTTLSIGDVILVIEQRLADLGLI